MNYEYIKIDTIKKLNAREKAIKYLFEKMRKEPDNYFLYKPIMEILEMNDEKGNKKEKKRSMYSK